MNRLKIVTFVPLESTDKVRSALGQSGAGIIGEYSFCSFSSVGKGRFIPSTEAHPYSGETSQLNVEDEERIEVVCNRVDAKRIIAAMRASHPYEEVAFDIYPLIDESEL